MLRPCKFCQKPFESRAGGAKFCSVECYFDTHAVKNEAACWEWRGVKRKAAGGYGIMRFGRANVFHAHRFSYERYVGPIPNGLFVLHRCDNPECANPKHLFVGTSKDNTRDMLEKGRGSPPPIQRGVENILVRRPELRPRGTKHWCNKISEKQALAIAQSRGDWRTQVAKYGVSRSLVYQLRARSIWKHLFSSSAR